MVQLILSSSLFARTFPSTQPPSPKSPIRIEFSPHGLKFDIPSNLSALVPRGKEREGRIPWGFPLWPVKEAGTWRNGNVALGIWVPESKPEREPLPSCLPYKWLHLAGLVSQPSCILHVLYSLPQCHKYLPFLPKLWRLQGPRNDYSTKGVEGKIWSAGQ